MRQDMMKQRVHPCSRTRQQAELLVQRCAVTKSQAGRLQWGLRELRTPWQQASD
jgi:hypothetical protein